MKTVELTGQLIAPCGINCGLCIAYQRDKNSCCGCNITDSNKSKHCQNCSIKNCPELVISDIKFCFTCKKYPCTRLKLLDKRYRLKYGMSSNTNLQIIDKEGIDQFIASEQIKWQCVHCGKFLCMHRNVCLNCGAKNTNYPTQNT